MSLNPLYLIAFPLDQVFVDHVTGELLANGVITFSHDNARNIRKPIYQLNGSPGNYSFVELPNPLTLSGTGTIVDGGQNPTLVYLYPYDDDGNDDPYYIECKSSANIPQWSRQSVPTIASTPTPPASNENWLPNQVSNPQFSTTFLNAGANLLNFSSAVNKVVPICPDWSLIVNGSGTITVEQIPLAGNLDIITSPPFALDITISSGITNAQLVQFFNANSGIWSSTASEQRYLNGMIVGKNQNSGDVNVNMYYEDGAAAAFLIFNASFNNSEYTLSQGVSAALPLSTNSNSGNNGQARLYINLLPNMHIRLTSLQVNSINDLGVAGEIPFDNSSSNRQLVYQGDYYLPQLINKRIRSALVGWDFPVNPAQLPGGTNFTVTTTAEYTWDQTIAKAFSGNITVSRSAVTQGYEIVLNGSGNAAYIMQYLDGAQAFEILSSPLSVNVNCYTDSIGADVTARIYLLAGNSSSIFPVLPVSIGTLNSDGSFSLTASGWSEIQRNNLPVAQFTVPQVSDINLISSSNAAFNKWQLQDYNLYNKFAIVVTFQSVATNAAVTINSVSLNLGDLASQPAPIGTLETLRQCQFFYESSYPIGVSPFTITTENANLRTMLSYLTSPELYSTSFEIVFAAPKRSGLPLVTLVSPITGNTNFVRVDFYNNAALVESRDLSVASFWNTTYNGAKGVSFTNVLSHMIAATVSAANVPTGYIIFYYLADARLGII